MLGKLIKYEFKATGRLLLPLYGALIIFAFINKIFMGDFFNNVETILGNLPVVLGMFVYIGTMVAIFVVTLFIIIQRYRTNLLGDEGYLMNTIPVRAGSNILSKFIVALVWTMVSILVSMISILILAYQPGLLGNINSVLSEAASIIYQSTGVDGILFVIEMMLMMISGGVSSILMIYASLSLGSLFNKRKILASFGAFIVLNMITNIVATCVQIPVMLGLEDKFTQMISGSGITDFSFGPFHIVMLVTVSTTLIFSIGYFIISNYILSKKLNLE